MRVRTFRLHVLVAAAVLASGLSSAAQTAPPADGSSPDDALQVTARLVVLDAVVVDRNGNFVPNLDRSKFHITEDKVPQDIRTFDPPSGHEMPAGSNGKAIVHSSADLPRIGNAPVNILVIDELNTPYMQIAYAQQMMERYLKAQPEVLPVPTLFIAAGATHIAVLHDFTQSRAELIASIHKHVTEADFTAMIASLNGGRIGPTGGVELTLGALEQIATSMRGFPGRKNVIWVGTGSKRSRFSGGGLDDEKLEKVVRNVTNRMLAAHMTLYTIDPEGVTYRSDEVAIAGSPMESNLSSVGPGPGLAFESFAYSTGGRVLYQRNDVETEIKETTTEGALYYTLSYSPTSAGNQGRKYRKINVTVDDPSYRVITRDGYFGGRERVAAVAANTEKTQPRALKFDLINAARTTMVYTGLHSNVAKTADGYSLQVNASDLQWDPQEDGSRQSEITVLAVCYDAKDKELEQHAAELKEQIEPNDKIVDGAKVAFAFPMVEPPKTARIRFVLRDAGTGTMGSVNATP